MTLQPPHGPGSRRLMLDGNRDPSEAAPAPVPQARPTIGLPTRHGDKAGPPLQAQSLRRRRGQFWATSSYTELSMCSPVDPECS